MTTHTHLPFLESLRPAGPRERASLPRMDVLSRSLDVRIGVAALLTAAVAWVISLQDVSLRAMTNLGLLSVLSPAFYVALGILTVSFVVLVHRDRVGDGLMFAHVGALIVIVHGTPAVLYSTLRYSWAWKHVGIVDYIQRNGGVDTDISSLDVYHNWPGFFGASALMSELGGFDARSLAVWAPVFFSLIDLFAVVFVFRALGTNRRAMWLAVWLFFVSNWVGQEYFSPQAMSYFLYLTLLAVILTYFRRDEPVPATPWVRGGMALVALGLMVALVSSHQLTPLMMIVMLTGLWATRVATTGWLAVIGTMMLMVWVLGPADAFVSDNIVETLAEVGAPATNSTTGVVDPGEVSSGQATVIILDRLLTVGLVAVAGLGIVFRWLRGHRYRAELVLLVSPIVLLGATDYDGEAMFRVYLFAVPFLALFAAHVVYPHGNERRSWRAGVFAGTVASLVLVAFLFAYLGKERSNYFTPQEVAAAEWLYESAPPNSLLIEGSRNYPSQFRNYENFTYVPIAREDGETHARIDADPVGVMGDWLDNVAYEQTYLLLTRSQLAEQDGIPSMPEGLLGRLWNDVAASGDFEAVYENEDAVVFQLRYEIVFSEGGTITFEPVERRMIQRTAPVVLLSTALAGVFLQFDTGGPLRAALMVWFFLAVPGLSLVGFFGPLRTEARVTLVIAISIVTTVIVSQALIYTDEWTVELGYAAVALVSLAGTLTQVLRSLGQRVAEAEDQRSNARPDGDAHHRPENRHLDEVEGGGAVGFGQSSS